MDAVIVGGGHNGLVCAGYLAQAGRRVLVLERRSEVGGAAVSERPFAGHDARLSRYAYLVSLFPRRIGDDLGIRIELATRRVEAYAPPNLLIPGPVSETDAWRAFHRMTKHVSDRYCSTFLGPLPTREEARERIGAEAWDALVETPLGATLRKRFDDPLVRGVIGTDGLIGTFASLDDPGLAQNRCFFWHVVGGPWRVPMGGMGAISSALATTAANHGAQIRTRAEVVRIDGGEVTWREDGREHTVTARHVVANVAPAVLDRLRGRDPQPAADGSQTKVNLLLDRLPRLRSGMAPETAFAGTFRLHESEDELETAYSQASNGQLPDPAPAELYCHSLTDPSIVPPGMHTLTLFGLHTPAALFEDDEAGVKATLADRYLDALDEHLEDPVRECIARDAAGAPCVEVKSPLDLERDLGLPRGNIFHGELAWPWQNGATGRWGVETDDPRIVVCGAGAVRGGGVSGIGGHNAAMAILERSGNGQT